MKRDAWRGFVFGVYALLMLTVTFIVIFVYRFVDYYLKADTGGYLLSNETLALLGIGLCGLSVWTIRRAGCARIEKALACAGWRPCLPRSRAVTRQKKIRQTEPILQ